MTRRLFGDQTADKRLRLIVPAAWLDTLADVHQPGEKRVPLRAFFHQQATCAGTALPRRHKRGLNSQVHRRIDIRRILNNQRIVAAHLEGKDFFRLSGKLAMQLIARIRTAGKQQSVEGVQRTQRLSRFPTTL